MLLSAQVNHSDWPLCRPHACESVLLAGSGSGAHVKAAVEFRRTGAYEAKLTWLGIVGSGLRARLLSCSLSRASLGGWTPLTLNIARRPESDNADGFCAPCTKNVAELPIQSVVFKNEHPAHHSAQYRRTLLVHFPSTQFDSNHRRRLSAIRTLLAVRLSCVSLRMGLQFLHSPRIEHS